MDNQLPLEKVSLHNFGCIREASFELKQLTALVGPNDSGKSTALRSVELLSSILTRPGGWADIVRSFEEAGNQDILNGCKCSFSGRLPFGDWRYEFGIQVVNATRTCRFEEQLNACGTTVYQELESIQGSHQWMPKITYQKDLDKGQANLSGGDSTHSLPKNIAVMAKSIEPQAPLARVAAAMEELIACFTGLVRYQFSPERIRLPVPVGRKLASSPIERDGFGLASAVAGLLLRDRERALDLEARLRQVLPNLGRIQIREIGTTNISYALEFVTTHNEHFTADWASDGLLYLLAYMVLLQPASSVRVLLLEEPENCLHPGSIEQLVTYLRGLSSGAYSTAPVQILLTTHSPLMVNYLEPEEIRVVTRTDEDGSVVRPFTSTKDLAERLQYQGPGELWVNLGEQGLFSEETIQ